MTATWWRSKITTLPVMSLLAAKTLVWPATSSSVERTFSQSGLINSAKRGRLGGSILETLLYLKVNWCDYLYNMSRAKYLELTKGWTYRKSPAAQDETNREFGIVKETDTLNVEYPVEADEEYVDEDEEGVQVNGDLQQLMDDVVINPNIFDEVDMVNNLFSDGEDDDFDIALYSDSDNDDDGTMMYDLA